MSRDGAVRHRIATRCRAAALRWLKRSWATSHRFLPTDFRLFPKKIRIECARRGPAPKSLRGSRQERGKPLEVNVAQRLACKCAQRVHCLRRGNVDPQSRVGWPVGIKPKTTIPQAIFHHRPHVLLQHGDERQHQPAHGRCRALFRSGLKYALGRAGLRALR